MSEKLHVSPQQPLPPDYRGNAVEAAMGREYDEMMLERNLDVAINESFDKVEQQAAASQEEYLALRPFKDNSGRIREANGKFAKKTPTSDEQRTEHLKSATPIPAKYSEMTRDQLDQVLSESQPVSEELRQKPEFKSVADDILNEKFERQKAVWSSMGMRPLARELAKAELNGEQASTNAISDILLEKMIAQTEKHGATAATHDRLAKDIIDYKEEYKARIATVEGQTKEQRIDQSRSEMDYDFVDNTRAYLDSRDADTAEIMKEIPIEAEGKGIDNTERFSLMPDSYQAVVSKDANVKPEQFWSWINSDRIDQEAARNYLQDLRAAGVPANVIYAFPETFFYKDGDSEQTDDLPQEFIEWKERHFDVHVGPALIGGESPEPIQEPEATDNSAPTDSSRSRIHGWKAGIKKFMTQEGAITWDKNGNAIVNTDLEKRTKGERNALIALGIGALAIGAAVVSAKTGGPNIADLWPFGGGGSGAHHEALKNATSDSKAAHDHLKGGRHGGSHGARGAIHQAHEAAKHHFERLTQDDTIWSHAQESLKKDGISDPSNTQIQKRTVSIMMKNGLIKNGQPDWEAARHLPVGFRFKI